VKDQRNNEADARPGTPGAVLRVISPAALALLGDLYGETAICAACTRAARPGRACSCGARATVKAVPAPGAGPPPGSPCRRCRTLTPKRTRGLCPRCYAQASRAEDYQFLIASGVHPDQAAARVGVSPRTIARDLAATARPRGRRDGATELKTA
jgi:RNA polymerase subunit RPABC4/transcription elongation factor Spt4